MKKPIISLLISLGISNILFAQWECPSQLGGNLNQFKNSNFSWGIELTGGAGYLTNSSIFNGMGLVGLNYTSKQHTFYFEGGIKTWYQGDYDLNIKASNSVSGLRELFYRNQGSQGSLTIGLQSMRSEDVYLLNERVLGFNYRKDFNRFGLNVFGGTVSKSFARNGTFCNMAFLYDILPYINQPLLGESLGQTNLAGLTLGFHPAKEMNGMSEDGLESDIKESSSSFNVETIGFALYSEFGSWIKTPGLIAGFYSNIEIGNDYWFKPEVLVSATGEQAIIYCTKAGKAFTWSNSHRTTFEAAYYGLTSISSGSSGHSGGKDNEGDKEGESDKGEEAKGDTKAISLFSNILAGTVLRLDSPDMPFCQFAAKHTIPSIKTHLKVQYTSQVQTAPSHELDIELGKKFFGKLLVNATYGYIKSPMLVTDPNLFRIEMRFNF